jgi:protein FAM32A
MFFEQLHERLQKEGVKTHKQKVEELNKYLSGLSEHHDMYVDVLSLLRGLIV